MPDIDLDAKEHNYEWEKNSLTQFLGLVPVIPLMYICKNCHRKLGQTSNSAFSGVTDWIVNNTQNLVR